MHGSSSKIGLLIADQHAVLVPSRQIYLVLLTARHNKRNHRLKQIW